MNSRRAWDRRRFVQAASEIGLAGAVPAARADEPPPETKRIRLLRFPAFDSACLSPVWTADQLLHAERFDDVSYLPLTGSSNGIDTLLSGAADITQRHLHRSCATEPERVTRTRVDRGHYKDDSCAVQAQRDIAYRHWRECDSEDSLRCHALRLHESGLIKSSPRKLLTQEPNGASSKS